MRNKNIPELSMESSFTAGMDGDKIELTVTDSDGWNISYDRTPTTVNCAMQGYIGRGGTGV